jgi:putative endonuclease
VRGRGLGPTGEALAADFLRARGYTILDANARSRLGEIDIVARENDEIVFVEVKTRSSDFAGDPLEAITKRKAAKLRTLAAAWVRDNIRGPEPAYRIDCVGILLSETPPRIDHVIGAVEG